MSLREDSVGLGERLEPPIKITQTLRVPRPEAGPGDRVDDSQHVVDPMREFERYHFALALNLNAISDFGILLDHYISPPKAPQTLGPDPSAVARSVAQPPAPYLVGVKPRFYHGQFLRKDGL
jgi:hypothetical protein